MASAIHSGSGNASPTGKGDAVCNTKEYDEHRLEEKVQNTPNLEPADKNLFGSSSGSIASETQMLKD